MKAAKWIIGLLMCGFIAYIVYRAEQSANREQEPTVKPQIRNISRTITVAGTIMPSKEIEVKATFSGVMERLLVRVGEHVNEGTPIAKIRFVTEPQTYQSNLRRFQIAEAQYNNDKRNYERSTTLFNKAMVSASEHENVMTAYLTSKAEYEAALKEWQFVKGIIPQNDSTGFSNLIASTAEGTILELPVKEGGSIMARGSFSEGTTVARIARLDALVFKGYVAEADISGLHEGMKLRLLVDAAREDTIEGRLRLIAPKGAIHDDLIKFEIEADVLVPPSYKGIIRAGYSANAVFTVATRIHALAIEEKNLIFSGDSTFVEVPVEKKGRWRKQLVRTGISDGVFTEIISGTDSTTFIKVQNNLNR